MAEGTINNLSKYVHRIDVTATTNDLGMITLNLSVLNMQYIFGVWCNGEWAVNIPTLVDGIWRIFVLHTNLTPYAQKEVTLHVYYI